MIKYKTSAGHKPEQTMTNRAAVYGSVPKATHEFIYNRTTDTPLLIINAKRSLTKTIRMAFSIFFLLLKITFKQQVLDTHH